MKRLPYLSSHLRNLNRSVQAERKRFFRLYPIALLVCGFGFGYVYKAERAAWNPVPLSLPSEVNKTPLKPLPAPKLGSYGLHQTWIGETRSGEPIREDARGIRFVW